MRPKIKKIKKKVNETNLDFEFRANSGPLDLLGTLLANVAIKTKEKSCKYFWKMYTFSKRIESKET